MKRIDLKVNEESLPSDSLIFKWNPQPDYYDAFSTTFYSEKVLTTNDVFTSFFYSFPRWFTILLHTRERIAKWIGLKTAPSVETPEALINFFEGDVGDSIALFEVFDKNETEMMTGQDDKHLDFRLSFVIERKANIYTLKMITSVKINAFIGRIYFLPVKPIHRLIVPICCKRTVYKMLE